MRALKKLIIVILSFTLVAFIVIYFYQKNVSDNLNQNNANLAKAWSDFCSNLASRDSLLAGLTSTNFDSLKYWIQKSILERGKKENSLELEFYEYKINKIIMDSFPNQKQIIDLNMTLNSEAAKYNSSTQDHNEYISIFPNFIISKRHNFTRAEYFIIKYGTVNEDPINKANEIPEWAKGVDTN